MAERHSEESMRQDDTTINATGQDEATEQSQAETPDEGGSAMGRRSVVKAAGAAVAMGGLSGLFGNASAVDASSYLNDSGDVTIPAGNYSWDGSGLSVASGNSLVGGGSKGDVVLNFESGTMDGNIEGKLENVVVRGSNNSPKAGINLLPGATVDGFIWPEGGQQSEDRAFYSPEGGDDRVTLRNSAWAKMVNNGAYIDKPPVTIENCAAVNNNIANIRVGHRRGTSSGQTTYIRNSIIAVTEDIGHDDTNVPNARGLRLRHPANLVVENCWFIYLDVNGTADLIELHDGAAGSNVTIRNCAFHNDSSGDLVRDKSNGEMNVTIENCTFQGSGSQNIEPSYSGSGVVTDDSVNFPLPSEVTGYAVADEISGVGSGIGPWGGSTTTTSTEEEETTTTTSTDTLVLHASENNYSGIDVSFTVDGTIEYGTDAESGSDTIVDNGDGTMTATSAYLNPDALDSYKVTGDFVDYAVPDNADVDVSLNGTTTTFSELVSSTQTTTETTTNTTDSTSTDSTTTDSMSSDSTTNTSTETTNTTTETSTTSDTSTTTTSDTSSSSSGELPHQITVTGKSSDATPYTFTVSGTVVRDPSASNVTADGTDWDEMRDIAKDGKVIGLVGSGVDAYRFDGNVTAITVDGDADVEIKRNA